MRIKDVILTASPPHPLNSFSPSSPNSSLHALSSQFGASLSKPFSLTSINIEYGRGQIETPLAPAIGVESADNAINMRDAVRDIAQSDFGWEATFCSKIAADGCGSGGHFNFSLRAPPGIDIELMSMKVG